MSSFLIPLNIFAQTKIRVGKMSVTDLTMLQGLVKGDPGAYRDEAMQQHEYYLSQYEIFKMKPSKDIKHFSLLIKFLSQVRVFQTFSQLQVVNFAYSVPHRCHR